MIVRHYEIITSIECDCCMQEEFIPELEETEFSIAWQQAHDMGWRKLVEEKLDYHFCPHCVEKFPPGVHEATPEQIVDFFMRIK